MNGYEIVRTLLDTNLRAVLETTGVGTKYRVVPLTRSDCDCPDCRAGKHLYQLERWRDNRWQDVAVSLQGYWSAEEARHHYWGIYFEPDAVWEDGTPVEGREEMQQTQPGNEEPYTGPMVPLDTHSLGKAAKSLEKHWCQVAEATVRLPPRSGVWVGVFTGPQPNQQIARSTGLRDREAALALTRRWEAQAMRQRRTGPDQPPPTRLGRLPGLTQREVAAILGLSERAIRSIERRAFRKLKNHAVLREIWAQLESAPTSLHAEDSTELTDEEVDALFGLVQSPLEGRALAKILTAVWTSGD
jgi:hypothetical protein